MKEIKVHRDSHDRPIKGCPYHEGLCGYAKVGSDYCLKQCPGYSGINPQTDTIYCMKEDLC